MTTQKAPLQPMRHPSIKWLCVFCLCVVTGCTSTHHDVWTWERWLNELSVSAGFSSSENPLNDLKSFEIIDTEAYELEDALTFKMVLDCAEKVGVDSSYFADAKLKESTVLKNDQAERLLKKLVEKMNQFGLEPHYDLQYNRPILEVNVIDHRNHQYLIEERVAIHDLVKIENQVFSVAAVEGQWITLVPATIKDVHSLEMEGSVSFDFDEATTLVHGEVVPMEPMPGAGLSAQALSQSFHVQGFQVRISTSSDSLHIYASRKTNSGQPMYVQFDINEINCSFKWKSVDEKVEASALKVSYETSLTAGLKSIDYEDRVLDFSRLELHDLFNSLKESFVKKSDAEVQSIELCEIQLPIPQLPSVSLKMKVLLHLYAGGRAEIGLESENEVGFEMMNGKLRWINDTKKDVVFSARASTKASTKLKFTLCALFQDLMDAAVELGVEGTALTKIQTEDQQFQTDASYEVLEEAVGETSGVKVCADFDAHWLMNIMLNSSDTMLGSLGFNKSIPVLNSSNASLFGRTIHLENFQRVERCTNTANFDQMNVILNTDRIELKRYVMILDEQESQLIEITGLPYAMSYGDIVYCSSDPQVATVSAKGRLYAQSSGNAMITVSLKDGSYAAQCSVFVR